MGSSLSYYKDILAEAPVSKNPDDYFEYPGHGPWFTCKPDGVMEPRCSKTGISSASETPPSTLPELLKKAAELKGDEPVMKVERPVPALGDDGKAPPALPDAEWTTWTYKQYYNDAKTAAKAFIKLGFQPCDTVNVWGFNAPEWMLSSLAANFAGGKVAGLYPTDTAQAAAYKVAHSGGSIIVVEEKKQLDRLIPALNARGDVAKVKALVAYGFEPAAGMTLDIAGCGTVPVKSWKEIMELGSKESDEEVDARTAAVKPGSCNALIYTSGTTGEPKAVMMSHDNMTFCAAAVIKSLQVSNNVVVSRICHCRTWQV